MSAKWQDWASFALGLWLALSPWIAGYAEQAGATGNAVTVGLVLALASHFECVACEEDLPVEWLNLGAGIWLVCAPWMLDFASRWQPRIPSRSACSSSRLPHPALARQANRCALA